MIGSLATFEQSHAVILMYVEDWLDRCYVTGALTRIRGG